jgi:hypothetical protein
MPTFNLNTIIAFSGSVILFFFFWFAIQVWKSFSIYISSFCLFNAFAAKVVIAVVIGGKGVPKKCVHVISQYLFAK